VSASLTRKIAATKKETAKARAGKNLSEVVGPTSLKLRGASGIFLKMSSNFFKQIPPNGKLLEKF